MNSLRFALRTLSKSPVFTGVAVLSLALGIGANTAIFTLMDQVLLRMLPIREPERIVQLDRRVRHSERHAAKSCRRTRCIAISGTGTVSSRV